MSSILYPAIIDTQSPITRGYREIARRIDYDVYAFATGNSQFNLSGINTINISDSNIGKVVDYIVENTNSYDIIHTGITNPLFLLLLPSTILRNKKLVYTAHNCEEMAANTLDYLPFHRKLMTKFCSKMTVPSTFISKSVQSRYNMRPVIIPNGVDRTMFHPSKGETNRDQILCVGRIVPRKNIDFVLDLARSLPELNFKLRGDPKRSYGRSVIRQAKDIDNVDVVPQISISSLAKLYAQSSVMLAPFEREGFGMSIIEALASGTPVIGYNDGNIPYLISNYENGYLVDELSVNKWSSIIKDVDCDLDPRQSVDRYSWKVVAEMYEDVYDSLA